jgi:hypothetical protein
MINQAEKFIQRRYPGSNAPLQSSIGNSDTTPRRSMPSCASTVISVRASQ